MPKIFNEDDRSIIKENLMKLGLEALENKGYKNSSVEDIARQAGIAKGTFYSFFQSKEHFYFEIMLSIRDRNRKDLYDFISSDKAFDRIAMENFLYKRYAERKNVYHYFTYDDFNIIFRKMPEQISISSIDSITLATELLAHIPNVNPNMNNEVIINILHIMGNYAADKGLLSIGSHESTIRFLANALATYILKEDSDENF